MVFMSELFSALNDAFAPLWAEIVMFALAAVTYMIFTRGFVVTVSSKSQQARKSGKAAAQQKFPKEQVTKPVPSYPRCLAAGKTCENLKSDQKELEELAQEYVPIVQAAKYGDAVTALQTMSALPKQELDRLPAQVASKVLLSLCKAGVESEEVMQQFTDLASSFNTRIFESAAAEASRWRSIPTCRQMYKLAGLAAVRKTERLVTLLVRGHLREPDSMREMIEEILADGSGVQLTSTLADALAAQCSGAGDQATLDKVGCGEVHSKEAKFISKLGKEGRFQDALDVFNTLKKSKAHVSTVEYNCMLDACAECRQMHWALKFYQEMKERSMVDVVSYNTLVKGHLKDGNSKAMRELITDMAVQGFQPSKVSYHCLLSTLMQQNDLQVAFDLVDEMVAKGIDFTNVTCSILLKGVTSHSHGRQLSKILKLTDTSGIDLDEVLCSSMADACIRSGNLRILWDQLEKLWARDPVPISGATYGSMMKAFGQARDAETVKHLWSKMRESKVKLTSITLGCMVEALVVNGLADDAWVIIGQLWEDRAERDMINTVSYSTIVKGFAMARQHDKVVAIYKEMKELQIRCNTITFNTMLNAMARCNMMHEVPQLLQDMQECNPPVAPDIVTYSTIIKGYCQSGDLDKGLELLDHMKIIGDVQPDEVLYNSLLDGCAKQQRLDQALKLLEDMKDMKVPPSNYTLSIACKLLGRARRLEQAFSMVASVSQEYGFRPNIQVYTCLMQACFHNRQGQRAIDLHDQIVSDGQCCLDEKAYTVITRGCLQAGSADQAAQVVRCAFHLPNHGMRQTKGHPQGVELACLEETLAQLGPQSSSAQALAKDLKEHRNITVTEASSISLQRPCQLQGARAFRQARGS